MKNMWLAAALLTLCGCSDTRNAPPTEVDASLVERGEYLVRIMDCSACHSPQPGERSLSGGAVGWEVSGLGVFWAPNLTPHPDAGLGRWSDEEIIAAFRTGQRPDGRELAPAMPWPAYAGLTDDDARAVVAFLRSLPESDNIVPAPSSPEQASEPYFALQIPRSAAPQ